MNPERRGSLQDSRWFVQARVPILDADFAGSEGEGFTFDFDGGLAVFRNEVEVFKPSDGYEENLPLLLGIVPAEFGAEEISEFVGFKGQGVSQTKKGLHAPGGNAQVP